MKRIQKAMGWKKQRLLRRSFFLGILVFLVCGGRAWKGALESRAEVPTSQKLALLLQELASKEPLRRQMALLDLGKLKGHARPALGVIRPLLRAAEKEVRLAALDCLQRLGAEVAESVLPDLTRATHDTEEDVRKAAASALAGLAGEKTASLIAPDLLRLTADSAADVRGAAIRALGRLAVHEGILQKEGSWKRIQEVIVRGFQDKENPVRYAAARSLRAFRTLSPEAALALRGATLDPSWLVRATALRTLGARREIALAAEKELTAALSDGDRAVRLASAVGLAHLGMQRAFPILRQAMAKGSEAIRLSVIQATKEFAPSKEIVMILRVGLLDDSKDVRREAILALGRHGELVKDALEILIQMLALGQEDLRQAAIWTLHTLGVVALPALRKALLDGSSRIREAAADALGLMGPTAAPAAPELVLAFHHTEWQVRREVASTIHRIGPAFLKHLPQHTAIWQMIRAFHDRQWQVRMTAILVLAWIGPEAHPALPRLQKQTKASEPMIRRLATAAIARIKDGKAPLPTAPLP